MSEEATRKNILAIKQHADITRDKLRDTEEIVRGYGATLQTLHETVVVLQTQIQALQIKLFTGGATHGDND